MKKIYRKYILLLPVLMLMLQGNSQDTLSVTDKVLDAIKFYESKMTLGKPEVKGMDQETIKEFKSIFKPGAPVFWDLYLTDDERLSNMTVSEYTDKAFSLYQGQKPFLTLDPVKNQAIKITGGNYVTVYLTKRHRVTPKDNDEYVNKIKLRMQFEVNDKALISNIMEDTRQPIVRSVSASFGYVAWNNVDQKIVNATSSLADESIYGGFSISSSPMFNAGIGLEFRIDRQKFYGMNIETGLLFSQGSYDIVINEYEYEYRKDFDTINIFICDVYDASKLISEKIEYNSFSIPLTFKYYPEKMDWLYLKAGPVFNYQVWNMDVKYNLSHTGGGLVAKVDNPDQYFNIPKPGFITKYGFDNSVDVNYSANPEFTKMTISLLIGAGIEKSFFDHIAIGLEPTLIIGPNALQVKDPPDEYLIYEKLSGTIKYNDDFTYKSSYQSFLTSLNLPSVSMSAMIMLRVSYLF